MILYHGSNVRIEKIDLSLGQLDKDFGRGFYLTDIKQQAEDMASRRCRITGQGLLIRTSTASISLEQNVQLIN